LHANELQSRFLIVSASAAAAAAATLVNHTSFDHSPAAQTKSSIYACVKREKSCDGETQKAVARFTDN